MVDSGEQRAIGGSEGLGVYLRKPTGFDGYLSVLKGHTLTPFSLVEPAVTLDLER